MEGKQANALLEKTSIIKQVAKEKGIPKAKERGKHLKKKKNLVPKNQQSWKGSKGDALLRKNSKTGDANQVVQLVICCKIIISIQHYFLFLGEKMQKDII